MIKIAEFAKSQARTTNWSGGTTTEFFVYPFNTSYGERNFHIRISSATVDWKESDFTLLPGYNRIITPLTDTLHLTFEETDETYDLAPLEMAYFNGAYHTHSIGKAMDFNVMYAKGLEAKMEKITTSQELLPIQHRFLYIPKQTLGTMPGKAYIGTKELLPDTLYYFPTRERIELDVRGGEVPMLYITVS